MNTPQERGPDPDDAVFTRLQLDRDERFVDHVGERGGNAAGSYEERKGILERLLWWMESFMREYLEAPLPKKTLEKWLENGFSNNPEIHKFLSFSKIDPEVMLSYIEQAAVCADLLLGDKGPKAIDNVAEAFLREGVKQEVPEYWKGTVKFMEKTVARACAINREAHAARMRGVIDQVTEPDET